MAASLNKQARLSLDDALEARERAAAVQLELRASQLKFISDAQKAGWSWKTIGAELGVTDTAVRNYWKRHRMVADRLASLPRPS